MAPYAELHSDLKIQYSELLRLKELVKNEKLPEEEMN